MGKVSRRQILGGATAMAAAGAVGGALPATAAASAAADHVDAELDEPLVVRVRDLRSGAMDVYLGQREVTIHDPRLAGQLFRAAR